MKPRFPARGMTVPGLLAAAAIPALARAAEPTLSQVHAALAGEVLVPWYADGLRLVLYEPLFKQAMVAALLGAGAPLLVHFLVIGERRFSHAGAQVPYFGLFVRLVHWLAAAAFSLLAVTGLLMVFGDLFGGDAPIRWARYAHIGSALALTPCLAAMFPCWARDMLPAAHDLRWLRMAGGYLSRVQRPVPAGKFNAGQKMWFWLATAGGAVMAASGFLLYSFAAPPEMLITALVVHHFLGALLLGFFVVHLYMSILAVEGSILSMITGSKPLDEVETMHPLHQWYRR